MMFLTECTRWTITCRVRNFVFDSCCGVDLFNFEFLLSYGTEVVWVYLTVNDQKIRQVFAILSGSSADRDLKYVVCIKASIWPLGEANRLLGIQFLFKVKVVLR